MRQHNESIEEGKLKFGTDAEIFENLHSKGYLHFESLADCRKEDKSCNPLKYSCELLSV